MVVFLRVQTHFELDLEQLVVCLFKQDYQLEREPSSIINQSQAMEFSTYLPLQISYTPSQLSPPCYYPYPMQFFDLSYNYSPPTPTYAFYLSNSYDMIKLSEPCQTSSHNEPLSSQLSRPDSSYTSKKPAKKHVSSSPAPKYAKKNAESNVINQIFSFISIRAKSYHLLTRLVAGDEQRIGLYYETLKQLKKRNKKYINRCYIKSLIELQQGHLVHGLLKRVDPEGKLSVSLMRRLLRVLITYYIKNVCVSAILTSSKLDPETKNEHLQRRTEIQRYLAYHIHNTHID